MLITPWLTRYYRKMLRSSLFRTVLIFSTIVASWMLADVVAIVCSAIGEML